MTRRKFHRYIYRIEVLSEEELGEDLSLSEIEQHMTEGECSGRFLEITHEELDGRKAAHLMLQQGSDPEFFQLTETGEDVQED